MENVRFANTVISSTKHLLSCIIKGLLCFLIGIICVQAYSIAVQAEETSDGYQYTYDEWTDMITITGYSGTDKNIKIPSTINGKTVKEISYNAFYNNPNIVSVVVPDSVTTIESYAFAYCSNLQSITLSKNISYIGFYQFIHSDKLTKIILPADSVNYCTYKNIVYSKDMKTLVLAPPGIKTVSIYPGVKTIGNCAFEFCDNVEKIILPEGVTKIEQYAFWGMDNLIFVTIPDSVTTIEDNIFYYTNSYPRRMIINNNKVALEYAKKFGIDTNIPCVYAFRATNAPTSLNLRWESADGADGYCLYRYDSSKKKYIKIKNIAKDKKQYKLTGLTPSTRYKLALVPYYKVDNNYYESTSKAIITITTLPKPYPKNVTNFSGKYEKNKNTLTWDAVPNTTGYVIYRYNNKTKKWDKIKTTKKLTYTDTKAGKSSLYKYKIRAYTKFEGKTYYSKKSTTLSFPALPGYIAYYYYHAGNELRIKWDKVSGADGYKVVYITQNQTMKVKYTKSCEIGFSNWPYSATVSPYKLVNGKKYCNN
ncbi:MAG: leucine-rich repeat protein [Coprococcus sp.]